MQHLQQVGHGGVKRRGARRLEGLVRDIGVMFPHVRHNHQVPRTHLEYVKEFVVADNAFLPSLTPSLHLSHILALFH